MGWRPTPALRRAVLLTGVLALGGVLLGRPDVVLLATPFALGTAWALRRRPERPPELEITAGDAGLPEGGECGATVSATNPSTVDYDLVVLRTRVSRWLALAPTGTAGGVDGGGVAPQAVMVPARRVAELALAGPARRWGRHRIGPAEAVAYAGDGLLVAGPVSGDSVQVPVYPVTGGFRSGEAMPRASGLLGSHRSRQSGPGGELAGVRQFHPGDRLRRVDWRVSLRTRQLHVAATLSDRDAEVVLVLDALTEAGRSGGVDGAVSVMDNTVRAAAAIAEHYLYQGDRVSLVEYGRGARRLRSASGRRQYLTVLEWLLDMAPGGGMGEPYDRVFGPHPLPAGVLVVVLTPLVDPGAAAMLARLVRSGRYVVAVDTLPPELPAPDLGQYSALAYRMWRLERENTIGALGEHGVPIVPWAAAGGGATRGGTAGGLDQVLRRVSRMPVAHRAVRAPGAGAP